MKYLPPVMGRDTRTLLFVLGTALILILPVREITALPDVPPPPEGFHLLEEATQYMLTIEEHPDEILRLINAAERSFRKLPDEQTRQYWIARAELARATRYNQLDEKSSAADAAARGLKVIERLLQDEPFSDGLRVLADLHAQMMSAKGLIYMIRNGSTARDAAIEALEREPRNIKAQITVAGFLLNAPPMAGGDTEQGRMVLERALAQEPASANDRFLILGWLAQASHTLNDMDAAEQYLAEALSIYPESEWLAEIGDEILEP